MNYEKKYKGALERASEFYNNEECRVGMTPIDLEVIFPELKESEDEKNTKDSLMQYIWDMYHKDFYSPRPSIECCDKWLAWLEKQGKQKPAAKLELDENGEPILTPFEAELFSMMSDAWQGYLLGEEVNIAEIVKEHSVELLERANEQKSDWSEEDEKMLADACIMLDWYKGNNWWTAQCIKDWLNSLKQRI